MKEEYLQYIWENRLFDRIVINGREVNVIDVGDRNVHDGPDFLLARIRIDGLEWVGDVEIHKKSSMWYEHRHHKDPRYQTIILHVVLENDREVVDASGKKVLTALFVIDDELLGQLDKLDLSNDALRCMPELSFVDSSKIHQHFSDLLNSRLSRKLNDLILRSSDSHVNTIFYRTLMRYMGAFQNNDVMEIVASSLPYIYLKKHAGDIKALEAMLLGQSGLIKEPVSDEYSAELLTEYHFYKEKFGLIPINVKFSYLRLRPSSFPARRLAIIAQLIHREDDLLSAIIHLQKDKIIHLLSLPPSRYWTDHIALGRSSDRIMGGIGIQTLTTLIINVVVPTAYYYARQIGDNNLALNALDWLDDLPAEKNRYLSIFEQNGFKGSSAADTQAMLELYHSYCAPYKCLSCPMASEIFAHIFQNNK